MANDNVKTNTKTVISDMKIIAHNESLFLLYPTKNKKDVAELRAIHDHVYYEFFFATKSKINFTTEKGEYSFTESIVVVPPKFKHVSYSEGTGNFCINVTATDVNQMGGKLGLLDYVKKDDITAFKISEEISFYLKKLLDANVSSIFGKAKTEALLRLIFLAIGETLEIHSEEKGENEQDSRINYILEIDKFVSNNYAKGNVDMSMLAEKMHLSVRQVSRIIKREFNCSFTELMNQKRMDVASILLIKSELSISQIINELNFETENYFYRVFRKRYGTTPLKYRKLAQKQRIL